MESGTPKTPSRKRFIQSLVAGFIGLGSALGLAATTRGKQQAGRPATGESAALPEVKRASRNVRSNRVS
ncbi:MAG: hypothetical protein ACFE0O_13695 [Opitutales bacterium]